MTAAVFAIAAGFLGAAIGAACGYIGGRRDGRAERAQLRTEVEAHSGEHPLPHLTGERPIPAERQRPTSGERPVAKARHYDWADELQAVGP